MRSSLIFLVSSLGLGITAFSPGAIGQDKARNLVEPVAKQVELKAVSFSPDGRYLAVAKAGDDGGIAVWDAKELRVHSRAAVKSGVVCLAFSPDSQTLAAGTRSEGCLLFSAVDGKRIAELSDAKSVRQVAFSSDGKTLAVGSSDADSAIYLYNYRTTELLHTLTGHTKGILDLAFAPDGKTLASSGRDSAVLLWDSMTGKLLREVQQFKRSFSNRIAFDPKGRWLAATSNSAANKVISLADGKILANFNEVAGGDWLVVSPTAKMLAICRVDSKGVQIHRLDFRKATAEEQKRILALIEKWQDDNYETREAASEELRKLGFIAEPYLRKAMEETANAETRVRARETRQAVLSPKSAPYIAGHSERMMGAAFSPDGRILVTIGRDGLINLWDTENLQIKTRFRWPAEQP